MECLMFARSDLLWRSKFQKTQINWWTAWSLIGQFYNARNSSWFSSKSLTRCGTSLKNRNRVKTTTIGWTHSWRTSSKTNYWNAIPRHQSANLTRKRKSRSPWSVRQWATRWSGERRKISSNLWHTKRCVITWRIGSTKKRSCLSETTSKSWRSSRKLSSLGGSWANKSSSRCSISSESRAEKPSQAATICS